jgi:hypothetical protein
MPWISKFQLESLKRAAYRSMQDGVRDDMSMRLSYAGMLLWRLNPANHKQPGELWDNPFEYMHAVDFGEEIVVFLLCNTGPLVIRENKAVFPSDALVAQCRLLLTG